MCAPIIITMFGTCCVDQEKHRKYTRNSMGFTFFVECWTRHKVFTISRFDGHFQCWLCQSWTSCLVTPYVWTSRWSSWQRRDVTFRNYLLVHCAYMLHRFFLKHNLEMSETVNSSRLLYLHNFCRCENYGPLSAGKQYSSKCGSIIHGERSRLLARKTVYNVWSFITSLLHSWVLAHQR